VPSNGLLGSRALLGEGFVNLLESELVHLEVVDQIGQIRLELLSVAWIVNLLDQVLSSLCFQLKVELDIEFGLLVARFEFLDSNTNELVNLFDEILLKKWQVGLD
jgi:hypothetical protein